MPGGMRRWPAVVIGGGLAGGAAALRMAQNGRRVLLLEKEASAQDKVCGEFISLDAQRYLVELGVDPAALGAESIVSIRLSCGRQVASAELPFRGVSLSRRVLDEALLLRAQAEGAQICRGANVTGISEEPEGWCIEVAGQGAIHSETVFLASGKHELRQWQRSGGSQNGFIGFKLHYCLAPEQRTALGGWVEMNLFNGGYAGLEPVEEGRANLCLAVSKRQYAAYGKSWEGLLAAIADATPLLAERLSGARPCWPRPLAIYGIPYGFVYRAPAGVSSDASPQLFRLGDQMAVIPSFSGYGMSIALYTARLAVECHLRGDAGRYHRMARRQLLPLVRSATAISKLAEYPAAQRTMLLACRMRPELLRWMARYGRIAGPAS